MQREAHLVQDQRTVMEMKEKKQNERELSLLLNIDLFTPKS
jgi:hypothetical protein